MFCFKCGKETGFKEFVGRGDSCSHCGADARVCKNCEHYDPRVYNECREPSAERVVVKDRSNFCDHFSMNKKKVDFVQQSQDLKKRAEELFKKKD